MILVEEIDAEPGGDSEERQTAMPTELPVCQTETRQTLYLFRLAVRLGAARAMLLATTAVATVATLIRRETPRK